jgi:hypothetical protein
MAPMLEGTMVRDPARRWSMVQVRDFLARSDGSVPPTPTVPLAASEPADADGTRVLAAVPPASVPATGPVTVPDSRPPSYDAPRRRPPATVLVGIGVAVLVLALALFAALSRDGSGRDAHESGGTPGTSPTAVTTPTAEGMESFIRDYVATVSVDPDAAWKMLTPKFQQESGGLEHYRSFWAAAANGKVLSISSDPAHLTVSYQVHFDHFDNGPGPTVLDLKIEDGHYLIDGERSKGFQPAG